MKDINTEENDASGGEVWDGFWAVYRSRDPEQKKRYAEFLESLSEEEVESILYQRAQRDEWDKMTDEDVQRIMDEWEHHDAAETAESVADYNRYLDSIRVKRWSTKWSFQRFSLGFSWSRESNDSGWRNRFIVGLGFFTIKFHLKKYIYRG